MLHVKWSKLVRLLSKIHFPYTCIVQKLNSAIKKNLVMETAKVGKTSQIRDLKGFDTSCGGFSDKSLQRYITEVSWKHFYLIDTSAGVTRRGH